MIFLTYYLANFFWEFPFYVMRFLALLAACLAIIICHKTNPPHITIGIRDFGLNITLAGSTTITNNTDVHNNNDIVRKISFTFHAEEFPLNLAYVFRTNSNKFSTIKFKRRNKYLASRFRYYANTDASFNVERNPGPLNSKTKTGYQAIQSSLLRLFYKM